MKRRGADRLLHIAHRTSQVAQPCGRVESSLPPQTKEDSHPSIDVDSLDLKRIGLFVLVVVRGTSHIQKEKNSEKKLMVCFSFIGQVSENYLQDTARYNKLINTNNILGIF